MLYSEGKIGRVFVIRLEEGDSVPACIEKFAAEKGIQTGQAILIGGLHDGNVVVGPRRTGDMPPDPMVMPLEGGHEVVGVGVLAPDRNGKVVFHVHAAMGRSGQTITGCLRKGVKTWLVGEVVLYEILGAKVARMPDEESGFDLLRPVRNTRRSAAK